MRARKRAGNFKTFPRTQIKMRGKHYMNLGCGCCYTINRKWEVRLKTADDEIKHGLEADLV